MSANISYRSDLVGQPTCDYFQIIGSPTFFWTVRDTNDKYSAVFIVHVKETHNIVTSIVLTTPAAVRNLEKPTCDGGSRIPMNCSYGRFYMRVGMARAGFRLD